MAAGGETALGRVGPIVLDQPIESRPRNQFEHVVENAIGVAHGVDPFRVQVSRETLETIRINVVRRFKQNLCRTAVGLTRPSRLAHEIGDAGSIADVFRRRRLDGRVKPGHDHDGQNLSSQSNPGEWEMPLLARAFAGFLFLFVVVASVFFGCSGTLRDGRAWAMLAAFFGCAGLITVWLWFRDQALLERRVKAGPGSEPDPMQNIVQALAGLVFLATFAAPGLDRRFGWSQVPPAVSLVGDAMIVLGFLIVFLTFRENSFTAGTIEVADGQRVIDSGPYAVVRHPMYAGALIMIAGIPPALGSWWGLIPAALLVPVMVWRLIREERFLAANLAGYGDYRSRVRYRLAPMVW
jgi:protein-S-isoprenylcysteine O-methyltransferase Ste14